MVKKSGLEEYAELFYQLAELLASGDKADALKRLLSQSATSPREMADAIAIGLDLGLASSDNRSMIAIIEQRLREDARRQV